jgi:hypothetical protein
MSQPVTNADGSVDVYFGPESPGAGRYWIAPIPDAGFFVLFRLYGPTRAFFDKSCKPDDVIKVDR